MTCGDLGFSEKTISSGDSFLKASASSFRIFTILLISFCPHFGKFRLVDISSLSSLAFRSSGRFSPIFLRKDRICSTVTSCEFGFEVFLLSLVEGNCGGGHRHCLSAPIPPDIEHRSSVSVHRPGVFHSPH